MSHLSLAQEVELLCLDVDGVMTDGVIAIDDHGIETKKFHVRDGSGMRMWMKLGFHLAIITGRQGMAVRHRADELGVKHVVQGCSDKGAAVQALLGELKLTRERAAMLADDLPDVPAMRAVGYPMAVADASLPVRRLAKFTTELPGGRGAVREAIEHLLRAKGRLDEASAMWK
jgi:3-deoxy-D-manno-octulosonate 8-phosphate phosphatase (KDO 8-P phosphatase)